MKKVVETAKLKLNQPKRRLDPEKPPERRQIVEEAVKRTLEEYGEALKKLGAE